jgi:hypothetical protein
MSKESPKPAKDKDKDRRYPGGVTEAEVTRRRFGREGQSPCVNTAVTSCTMLDCQIQNRCQFADVEGKN